MSKPEPYPWQQEAVFDWMKNEYRGTIAAVTGAGKTVAACFCIGAYLEDNPNAKVIIIVHRDFLLKQWQKELEIFGLSDKIEIFMLQTAWKYPLKTDLLVVDEVHRTLSDKFGKIWEKDYKHTLGLSATPNGGELYSGKVLCNITFKQAHVSEFDIEFVPVDLTIGERREYQRLTDQLSSIARSRNMDEKKKDRLRLNIALRRRAVCHNSRAKMLKTMELFKAQDFGKTLIFSERIANANKAWGLLTAQGIATDRYHTEVGEIGLKRFKNDDVTVLCSVGKLVEGFDDASVDTGILLSSSLTNTHFIQAMGRILRYRKDKTAKIIVLYARETSDEKLLKLPEFKEDWKEDLEQIYKDGVKFKIFDGKIVKIKTDIAYVTVECSKELHDTVIDKQLSIDSFSINKNRLVTSFDGTYLELTTLPRIKDSTVNDLILRTGKTIDGKIDWHHEWSKEEDEAFIKRLTDGWGSNAKDRRFG